MAKKPTIRLKKTELPMDSRAADELACERENIVQLAGFDELKHLHQVDGNATPDAKVGTTNFYQGMLGMSAPGYPAQMNSHTFNLFLKRMLDCESFMIPWAWRPVGIHATSTLTSSGKVPEPTIKREGSTLDLIVGLPEGDASKKQFAKISRYLRKINWACLTQAIPIQFKATMSTRRFDPYALIEISLARRWICGEKYNARSLLAGSTVFKGVPAEFDPAEVLKVMAKDSECTLRSFDIETNRLQQIVSICDSKSPSSAWIEELMLNRVGSAEDVCSGKAPIPPQSEIVTFPSMFKFAPEMKRILRTLMRISKPYDKVSFLPVGS